MVAQLFEPNAKPLPSRAFHNWSAKEDHRLRAEWGHGTTVPELTEIHGRSYKAIVCRLQKIFGDDFAKHNPRLYSKVKRLEQQLALIRMKGSDHV